MSGVQFYRDKDLPFFELKICSTSELSYKKHAHEEYSVGLVNRGKSRFWHEGTVDVIAPRVLVFVPPDCIHSCNPVYRDLWQYKMLYIERSWIRRFVMSREYNILDAPRVRNISANREYRQIDRILDNMASNISPLEKEANIIAVFEQSLSGEEKIRHGDSKIEQPKVKIIREYLDSCFLEKVTLDQLEQISGLNKFHIIRLFKAAYQVPPHIYQTFRRVNYAKKELCKQRQLAEVALAAGFYDQSHFCKVFKSYTGITPERYQQFS